jgi:hypothetical protein
MSPSEALYLAMRRSWSYYAYSFFLFFVVARDSSRFSKLIALELEFGDKNLANAH